MRGKFNDEIGPSNSVNIVGYDAPERLSFDFVPDDEPDRHTGTICWAPKDDTRQLGDDAWAKFSDAIRRYSGIKLTYDDGDARDGAELVAVNLTMEIPVVTDRNPEATMRHARRTIDILHRQSPCVTR